MGRILARAACQPPQNPCTRASHYSMLLLCYSSRATRSPPSHTTDTPFLAPKIIFGLKKEKTDFRKIYQVPTVYTHRDRTSRASPCHPDVAPASIRSEKANECRNILALQALEYTIWRVFGYLMGFMGLLFYMATGFHCFHQVMSLSEPASAAFVGQLASMAVAACACYATNLEFSTRW